ncbi:MAG: DUF4388 domain-containing protein [Nitrospirota bacterium]|nr:DUF4388 domain-containing protein [Nitrospirota bacterium]
MAFTGELEHLHIVDVIQLVHTTRKSGIFSVKGDRGESTIVFSSGAIVGANHLNDSVRIGTILVKMGAISVEDLKQALDAIRDIAAGGEPLLAALIQSGKLKQEDALKGLRTLVEITIVELMGWSKGTFTFDTDAPVYAGGDSGTDVALDAQMVLMDALRVFDERERDRANGKDVPSFESLYAEVLPGQAHAPREQPSTITADLLGLADVERLEKKIPRPVSEMELFDPLAIHRQKIRELLAAFSPEEQDAFVAFLQRSLDRKAAPGGAAKQSGKAVVLFSSDKLIRHSAMTICKEDGVPVFSAEEENDLERTVEQCLSAMRMPIVVFDSPGGEGGGFPEETIIALRNRIRGRHPAVPLVQFAAPQQNDFILRSYSDGVWAVLPKPTNEGRNGSYVSGTIQFLAAFKSYIKDFQYRPDAADRYIKELKKDIKALREIVTPSDAALVLLITVADMFERAITFIVRPGELAGERAIGVTSDKSEGPTHADRLRIPLAKPSVFREAIEKGQVLFGESRDGILTGLFQQIGAPLSPSVVLLPVISDRKVVAVVYGDFGKKAAQPVQIDILEILSQQVGISLEYALFRRHVAKAAQKA